MQKLLRQSSIYSGVALYSLLTAIPALAQISPDGSLPTKVNRQGNVFEITGGAEAGKNLFHSFREFSVPLGTEAFFKNVETFNNVISRVTGMSPSQINGLIRANGTANLFLINPNGIIFGENARLNIGGSFFGSTANSIVFPEGEFSATDTKASVTLIINAPIGFSLRDNPGEIVNQSFADDVGLQVLPNKTLALVGGDIFIEGGLFTEGGTIELGSVADNSLVNLIPTEQGFTLEYEGIKNFGNISLFGAILDVSGDQGGAINIQGKNVALTNGTAVISTTLGEENGKPVTVNASDSIELDGGAVLLTATEGDGNAGDLIIETGKLALSEGAFIVSTVCFELGNCAAGSGGNLKVTASDLIELSEGAGFFTGTEADGNAANLNIQTPKLTVQDALIQSQPSIDGEGRGGDLTIETGQLIINGRSEISTTTFGTGDGGDLSIKAAELIELMGNTRLSAQADKNTTGNAGNLTIDTGRLIIRDGAQIATGTFGIGQGGTLTINADDSILLNGTLPAADEFGSSAILVAAEVGSTGNGGELIINTGTLTVENKARISADTFGTGKGANVTLNVDRLIIQDEGRVGAGSLIGQGGVDNQRGTGGTLIINANDSIEVLKNSRLFTSAEGTGNAGNLKITTNNLTVQDGGEINASATGTGAAGNLTITANNINLNNGSLTAATEAKEGGNIKLEIAENLTLRNNSQISALATNNANGGNVDINADFIIAFPNQNNDILASAQQGNGGNINISAEAIFGIQERPQNPVTNDIDASSQFGLDGSVSIFTPDTDISQGVTQLPTNVVDVETIAAKACNVQESIANILADKETSLTIKGTGGVRSLPTDSLTSDAIHIDGKFVRTRKQDIPSQLPASSLNLPSSSSIRQNSTFAFSFHEEETEDWNQEQQETELEEQVNREETEDNESINPEEIIPARGMIYGKNGEIILVGYPTSNVDPRVPYSSGNCGISK